MTIKKSTNGLPSRRLNNAMRNVIKQDIIDDNFTRRFDNLNKAQLVFADKMYKHVLAKHLKAMAALPKGWLPTTNELIVYFGGQRHTLSLCPENIHQWSDEGNPYKRPVPAWWRHDKQNTATLFTAEHALAKEYWKLHNRKVDLKEERRAMERKIETLLSSVTTTKQFIQSWPMGAKYLPELANNQEGLALPAELINGLDDMVKSAYKAEQATK